MTEKMKFVVEKKPAGLSCRNKQDYMFILDCFRNLKSDETIKLPINGKDEKQARNRLQTMKATISKHAGDGLKCSGTVLNGYIYLYKRAS